jgi:maltose O-acetyltransferase
MQILKKILLKIRGKQDIAKLVKRGLIIGDNFKIMENCIIDPSHCWHIEIGNNVILAPHVHILAHDASTKLFLGYTKVANVKIGNNVFIGATSTILPGVTIGNNVIIGAGSVVSNDISDNSVAVGVPARIITSLQKYLDKEKSAMRNENCFDESYTLRNPDFCYNQKKEMVNACNHFKKIYVE